jgi:hypothetical protein
LQQGKGIVTLDACVFDQRFAQGFFRQEFVKVPLHGPLGCAVLV